MDPPLRTANVFVYMSKSQCVEKLSCAEKNNERPPALLPVLSIFSVVQFMIFSFCHCSEKTHVGKCMGDVRVSVFMNEARSLAENTLAFMNENFVVV